jgi:hypothetical protein
VALYSLPATLTTRLIALRRGLLLALLGVLYLVFWLGPATPEGKTFFIVHLGLFLLWQPFVETEQRLSAPSLVGLAGAVLLLGVLLKGWVLVLWIMMLAGIVGGKVLLPGARAPRLFHLMALAFLVVALLLMAAPLAAPIMKPPQSIRALASLALPMMLVVMSLLPRGGAAETGREVVDFVYSLAVFLLLAVLMLGSLAAMLLRGSGYIEALLQTLLVTGTMLLLLALTWSPHSGFVGLSGLFSRYVMSIGLPVEQWLQALTDLAQKEEDPQAFLDQACAEVAQRLPWVTGGEWVVGRSSRRFGVSAPHRSEFSHEGMMLVLYTSHPLSPTLAWHCNLLAQLLAQFHADKQRALALKQLSYMQAIHETGARLTHDVKNLLQSLNALCSAGGEPGAAASPQYQSLLRRQLPAISERLAETLAKLNAPQSASPVRWTSAADWWQALRQRMVALTWLSFEAEMPLAGELPAEVFSGVAENLIRNVAEKRLREPSLRARIELRRDRAGYELIVADNGGAMAGPMAASLFVGPVSSESGYGTGLHHAARYAKAAGYRLELAENRAGAVCFRLVPER